MSVAKFIVEIDIVHSTPLSWSFRNENWIVSVNRIMDSKISVKIQPGNPAVDFLGLTVGYQPLDVSGTGPRWNSMGDHEIHLNQINDGNRFQILGKFIYSEVENLTLTRSQ